MALRFMDSFDHYTRDEAPKKGWAFDGNTSAPFWFSIGYGRNGTSGLQCVIPSSTYNVTATLGVPGVSGTTGIVGFAINLGPYVRVGEMRLFSFLNGGTEQVSLTISVGGLLTLRRGGLAGTALTPTGTTALVAATWYFLEVKVLFSDTVGTYALKVNGVSELSGSGADTVASGTAGWDAIRLGSAFISDPNDPTWTYDDLYICDGSGGVHDDFLGDHRIIMVPASSGNGTYTQWTPSVSTDHGALVDDATPNTTDYNSSLTVGHRDTYNFAPLGAASGTIKAVQTVNYIKAEVSGIRQVADVAVIGGTPYDGVAQLAPSDWMFRRELHPTSPASAVAWTIAEVDAAEFGVKVTA